MTPIEEEARALDLEAWNAEPASGAAAVMAKVFWTRNEAGNFPWRAMLDAARQEDSGSNGRPG